jgi:site-specific recombinase XerD
MSKNLLGPWVRRYLLEHLVNERNLAHNTQKSYRDTLCLLLPFIARSAGKRIDQLQIEDLSATRVRAFLKDLQETRNCGAATCNQRLAAIHSLSNFIGLRNPEYIQWCGEIRDIPLKKVARPLIAYLEKDEIDALLMAPDRNSKQGLRDYAVLLFLYNTGARADEAAHVRIGDLNLQSPPDRNRSSVLIHGKGSKLRRCPLWISTTNELIRLIGNRIPSEQVFLNRRSQPLTRFGIHALVERYALKAAAKAPSLKKKRVSPHTIRHTTATHLLRSGVDINTIRAWLGHVSISTTNIYAEIDLEMKAKALATCAIDDSRPTPCKKTWREDGELMDFLKSL